jgi:serine/threonine protein kinase/Flp pilus assembly protein TadD/TolB-like protein
MHEMRRTTCFAYAQRERRKVEALFAELKNQIGLRRLRLRRLKFVREQFFLAAAAQNIRRLVRFLSHGRQPPLQATTKSHTPHQQLFALRYSHIPPGPPERPFFNSHAWLRQLPCASSDAYSGPSLSRIDPPAHVGLISATVSLPSPSLGQLLGHYRILEQIGAGGMGVVYRAHDLQLDRDVAVKVLPAGTLADSGSRSRFRKEALALARLNHPNIATVHEFGTQDRVDFLVTEYIAGITLDSKLMAGPFSQQEALNLGIQLAQGLEAAHEQGIVHRDLKPGNLRLTPKGQLKILDFGLAKLSGRFSANTVTESLSRGRSISGTLPYMAPEQVRGQQVDERSDIWAAGAVLYEMVTGHRPFPEKHSPQLIDDILRQPVKPPTSVNARIAPELESIILKALDKNPERRYQSARELRADLNRLQSITYGTASQLAATVRAAIDPNRKATVIAAIIALAILLALAGSRWRSRLQTGPHTPRILAVLPFRALGGDDATNALGAGMTETLTAQLAQVNDRDLLQLVSTREIEAQGIRTAEQARREFGVDLVLEGSLQQAGSQLRINCSLVDANTHRQLGARSLTAAVGDIFSLEDQVVTEALNILSVEIAPAKLAKLKTHPDTKPEAYEHYLRGLGYLQEYHKPENIQSAIAEFGLALQIDSKYGRAYAGAGEAYWLGFQESNRTNNWITKAAENCRKALVITPEIAEGHSCLGDVYNGQGEYRRAVDEFKRAVALDSSRDNALRGLADAYEKLGDVPAADATYQQAIALRPHYWAGYNSLGTFYFRQSRYADAVKMFQRVVELTPENFQGYSNLGALWIVQGQYSKSIQALERSIEIRPTLEAYSNLGGAYFALRRFADAAQMYNQGLNLDDRDSLIWGNLGDALYWTPGRRTEAVAAYRKAISRAGSKLQVNPRDATLLAFVATYNAMVGDKVAALSFVQRAVELAPSDADVRFRAALVYNQFGDTEQTLSSLEKAIAAGYPPSAIRDTPDFDHLRDNHRVQALLRKP